MGRTCVAVMEGHASRVTCLRRDPRRNWKTWWSSSMQVTVLQPRWQLEEEAGPQCFWCAPSCCQCRQLLVLWSEARTTRWSCGILRSSGVRCNTLVSTVKHQSHSHLFVPGDFLWTWWCRHYVVLIYLGVADKHWYDRSIQVSNSLIFWATLEAKELPSGALPLAWRSAGGWYSRGSKKDHGRRQCHFVGLIKRSFYLTRMEHLYNPLHTTHSPQTQTCQFNHFWWIEWWFLGRCASFNSRDQKMI